MSVPTITVEEVKKRLESGVNTILLDVRQPEEHSERNIEGNIFIPLGELRTRVDELTSCKDQEIIVYCRSGVRSATAVQFLLDQGFIATNMAGGILKW